MEISPGHPRTVQKKGNSRKNREEWQTYPRCVNCSLSLRPNVRKKCLGEASDLMHNILTAWILPVQLTSHDILCEECFNIIRKVSTNNCLTPRPERVFGHMNVCYGCGVSTLNTKTHKVPRDCPERNTILNWTPSQQVARLEKVCQVCWLAAGEEVRRQCNRNRPFEAPAKDAESSTAEEIEFNINSEVEPAQNAVELIKKAREPKVTSRIYERASATSAHCIFPGCQRNKRLLVPSVVKEMLLMEHKFYVPMSARICKYHLDNYDWDDLTSTHYDFTGQQMDNMMSTMERANRRQFDFSNLESQDDDAEEAGGSQPNRKKEETEDKYDILGKYVAVKVRQLDIEQRMCVERIIYEAIYEGQMGHLNINSQLVVNTGPFVSGQSYDDKRMELEDTEVEVVFDIEESEFDIEESESEDETEEESQRSFSLAKRKCSAETEEIPKLSPDVPNIEKEIITEGFGSKYIPDTQPSTENVSESCCPVDAKRKRYNKEGWSETHPEREESGLKTEIECEESWYTQERHFDYISTVSIRNDEELSKVEIKTEEGSSRMKMKRDEELIGAKIKRDEELRKIKRDEELIGAEIKRDEELIKAKIKRDEELIGAKIKRDEEVIRAKIKRDEDLIGAEIKRDEELIRAKIKMDEELSRAKIETEEDLRKIKIKTDKELSKVKIEIDKELNEL